MVTTFCCSQSLMLVLQPCKGHRRGRQARSQSGGAHAKANLHLLKEAVLSSNRQLRDVQVAGAPQRGGALGPVKAGAGEDVGVAQILDERVCQPIRGPHSAAALPLSTANQKSPRYLHQDVRRFGGLELEH